MSQNPGPKAGCTGKPRLIILHSCSWSRGEASAGSRTSLADLLTSQKMKEGSLKANGSIFLLNPRALGLLSLKLQR